jgi:hypothetical protein
MKTRLHLLQTNLIINTAAVYTSQNVQYYKSICGRAVVEKLKFDVNGDNVYIIALNNNLKFKKSLVKMEIFETKIFQVKLTLTRFNI